MSDNRKHPILMLLTRKVAVVVLGNPATALSAAMKETVLFRLGYGDAFTERAKKATMQAG